MLLLLFTNYNSGKLITIKNNVLFYGASVFAAITSIYFGISLTLSYFGENDISLSVYPYNTETQIEILVNETNLENADEIADKIISQNPYVTVAYSAKARYAYSQGDFAKVIEYNKQIFNNTAFSYDEYEEYCYMLINGIALYNNIGDTASADVCYTELKNAIYSVHTANNNLSEIGTKIKDQPISQLPEDIENYIKKNVS